METAAFLEIGNVAVKGPAVINDFPAFESLANFSYAAFDRVLRSEADAVADFLE